MPTTIEYVDHHGVTHPSEADSLNVLERLPSSRGSDSWDIGEWW
jgi:hypothetical protein